MKIIPSQKTELITELSIQEVRDVLREHIQPKKGFSIGLPQQRNKKVFEGFFESDQFQIRKVSDRNNSFSPQIHGHIKTDLNNTKLIINFRVHGFVLAFIFLWIGLVFMAFITTIIGVVTQEGNPLLALIPLLMIVFAIGLTHFGFNSGKENAIRSLKKVLKATS